jgi:hypothetical protein
MPAGECCYLTFSRKALPQDNAIFFDPDGTVHKGRDLWYSDQKIDIGGGSCKRYIGARTTQVATGRDFLRMCNCKDICWMIGGMATNPATGNSHFVGYDLAEVCAGDSLGFGYTYNLFPTPYGLNTGYNVTPRNGGGGPQPAQVSNRVNIFNVVRENIGADTFIWRWTEGLVGQDWHDVYFNDKIEGAYPLEMWVSHQPDIYLPFKAVVPHRNFDDLPSAYHPEAPSEGIWMHSQPKPIIFPKRIMNGPGPFHTGPWAGAEWTLDMPDDIKTQIQVYCNYNAKLRLVEGEGGPSPTPTPTVMQLTVSIYVIVHIGYQMDFDWLVPVTSLLLDMNCPTNYELVGSTGVCGALRVDKDLGSVGCICTCMRGGGVQPPGGGLGYRFCKQMDWGWNGLCQMHSADPCFGDCTQPPITETPCCHGPHPRFMTESILRGSESLVTEVNWPYTGDFTFEKLQEAFEDEGFEASMTISEFIALKLSEIDEITITSIPGEPTLAGLITAKATIANINTTLPESIIGTAPLGDLTERECTTTINVVTAENCYPCLQKIKVTSVDGFKEWLKAEHFYLLTDADTYWAGNDITQNPDRLRDLVNAIAPLPYPLSAAEAYMYICFMHESYQNINKLLNKAINDDTMDYGPIPLRTDCLPNGFDDETNEFVFGVDGPFLDTCIDLYGWREDLNCEQVASFSRTDLSTLFYGTTQIMPPSQRLLNPGYFCYGPCWKLIAKGAQRRKCQPWSIPPCEQPEPPWWCDDEEPNSESETCHFNDYWFTSDDEWPRLWVWLHPRVQIRIKFEGGFVKLRVRYEIDVLRETSCILEGNRSTEDPPSWAYVGVIEIGKGARWESPVAGACIDCPDGNHLPDWLKTHYQAIPTLLCGCFPDDPARISVVGSGNRLEIYV